LQQKKPKTREALKQTKNTVESQTATGLSGIPSLLGAGDWLIDAQTHRDASSSPMG